MSLLFPCSVCRERVPGKLASCTAAWWNAANDRVAWRQKLCTACYASIWLVWTQNALDAPLSCPGCHTLADDAVDPTYLTAYLPGIGAVRYELATCGPCAVTLRVRAQEGAEKLPDRRLISGGQDPGPQTDPATSAWAALGILPRE